jgi:hypothetical protein
LSLILRTVCIVLSDTFFDPNASKGYADTIEVKISLSPVGHGAVGVRSGFDVSEAISPKRAENADYHQHSTGHGYYGFERFVGLVRS